MATQFAKQSSENNYNYGIKYDYGSIMHYSDSKEYINFINVFYVDVILILADSSTNRVTMLAKEKIYQHTMGNNVAPSFLDVMEMNIYYRCLDNCANSRTICKNGGYRHPLNCDTCMCPTGFGGTDCSDMPDPENGPPMNCGRIVEASKILLVLYSKTF